MRLYRNECRVPSASKIPSESLLSEDEFDLGWPLVEINFKFWLFSLRMEPIIAAFSVLLKVASYSDESGSLSVAEPLS